MTVGLLLLLISLCGSWAHGEDGTLYLLDEQTKNETSPDIWKAVTDLQVEMKAMSDRVTASEGQVGAMNAELTATKVHLEQMQKENSGTRHLHICH